MSAKPWTETEDEYLIRHQGNLTNHEIGRRLGRSGPSVENRTQVLRRTGIIPNSTRQAEWTEDEDRRLVASYNKFTVAMLAEDFGRTPEAVRSRLRRLKRAGWQIDAMPRGRGRSKLAEAARAAHKPPELSVTAERIAMRDEVMAYLGAQVKRNALAWEQAQVIAQTISQNVLQAPEWRFKQYAQRPVAEIVQGAA